MKPLLPDMLQKLGELNPDAFENEGLEEEAI